MNLNRFYTSMMNQNEDWKLIGYWPKILQRIHLLDRNIESILTKEASQQCYLNASIYGPIKSSSKHVTVASKRKVTVQQTLSF